MAVFNSPLGNSPPFVSAAPGPVGTSQADMNAATSPTESVIQQSRNSTAPSNPILRFPAETIQLGTLFRFVKYSYDNQATNTKLITSMSGSSIALPLPQSIANRISVSYQNVNTGVVGYAARAGASSVETLFKERNSNQQVKALNKTSSALAGAAYVVRRAATELMPSTEDVADQILGSVENPFNVATFQHSDTRSYNLSFVLVPQNATDSNNIKQICDEFYYHSLPSRGGPAGSSIQGMPLFLDMPDEVEVSYFGSKFLYRFARAVITSVVVDYSPLGAPSFVGSGMAPTAVTLTIGLSEIQQLTREAFTQAGFTDSTPAANTTPDSMFAPPTLPSP